jgi:hypothetical protein
MCCVCMHDAGIYEEINANVLVVADFRAFNKDRVEQLVEIVHVKVCCRLLLPMHVCRTHAGSRSRCLM